MTKPNRICSALIVFALVAISGCFNSGPPDAEKQSDEQPQLLSRVPLKYDKLNQFLSEEEKPAIEEVHRKYGDILENWNAEHGETVRDARTALFDFVKTKNKTAARDAIQRSKRNNVKELIKEEQAIQKEYEAALMNAIPAEKLKHWQADKISRTLLEFLEPLQLTDGQVRKVHELAPRALQQIRPKDKKFWHASGTVNLEVLVGQQVLTPTQQQPFDELKAKHRLRKMKWAL